MAKSPKSPDSEPSKHLLLAELRVLRIVLAIVIGLGLAGGVAAWQIHKDEMRRETLRAEALHPVGAIGGPFTLTDQDGKTVSDTDFRGKFLLVYFGYTYCPDLCPTGLSGIAHVLDTLGSEAKKVQTLFITIDPARDTPAKLKQYVESFHPGIMGLTGTPEQIAAVAKEYKVYYAKGEVVEGHDYIMDHSNLIYLMGPGGTFLTSFPDDADPDGMAVAVRRFMDKQQAAVPAK
ncbi:MAG TPA: SCO family protein [Alphaproteobacteria bacterium]|nr:SCO family protein [Alphaproteobacteria bacterium]